MSVDRHVVQGHGAARASSSVASWTGHPGDQSARVSPSARRQSPARGGRDEEDDDDERTAYNTHIHHARARAREDEDEDEDGDGAGEARGWG